MSYDNFPAKKNYTSNNIVSQVKKSPYEQSNEELTTKKQNYKQKNRRMKLIKGAINRPGALVNKTGNARNGKSYFVSQAKGGSWHTYDNGKRVFVKRKKNV